MATKKEIKAILKELNVTETDMQHFWDELIEINSLCKSLHRSGKKWSDLPVHLIRQIPTQKEKDLEATEKRSVEEAEKAAAVERAKKEKAYYNEHFEEIMIQKIDKHEDLTEKELSRLREYSIEDIEGNEGRWTRSIDSIVELCGRTFMLHWQRGLTEYQENEFMIQPYEVAKREITKTVVVTEWVKIGE